MNISGITTGSVSDLSELTKKAANRKVDADGDFDGTRKDPPSADTIVSQLTSKLGLNDNQAIELKKIIQNGMKNMEANRPQGPAGGKPPAGGPPPGGAKPNKETQDKMKSAMDEMDNQIKSLLNTDQLATFNKMLAERESQFETTKTASTTSNSTSDGVYV